ncbi:MAG TPA: redox-sensing transcriptional repressor Rex [Clostridiales bacterium]|nr:redox-sensing transcriptional repressor Rex [Clostridiales bacterium]
MEKISPNVIRRLPRYYRYLVELEEAGEAKVSSSRMSAEMGLNASQIRRDLNCFGGFGQQGYGYSVSNLKKEIMRILGMDKSYNMIIVGAGRIGQALMGYQSFSAEGFHAVDIFDSDEKKIGTNVAGRDVLSTRELSAYLKAHTVDIAIICTPKEAAQQTADLLVSYGLTAIWNFAPVDVAVRRGVAVENVHLSDSLYVLSYKKANV